MKVVQKWNPTYNNSPVIGSAVNTSLLTQATTTDYVGNIIYENGLLKRILVEGGYYEGGNYYFYIRDHLGNNRIVANAAASVVQSTQYYPFGMPFADAMGQNLQPYKYNGKELDTRNGLNLYDYSARYMDFAFPHFPTVDPLAEKYYSISPYVYCLNNPLKYIDPTGMAANPIYDEDGNLLGTDDRGLQGKALVMNKDDFKQGMSNKEALKKNLGKDGLKDENARKNLVKSFSTLSQRPDYDGKLTLGEANEWYRNGNGEPLYVDAAKIDLSPVTTKDLVLNKGEGINFASPGKANTETGLVYGTLTLTLTNESTGAVRIGNQNTNKIDTYDFDQQEGRFFRNIATKIGEAVAGKGIGYPIYGYGVGSVKVK